MRFWRRLIFLLRSEIYWVAWKVIEFNYLLRSEIYWVTWNAIEFNYLVSRMIKAQGRCIGGDYSFGHRVN